jgi:methionyl-tRNA formyltransferase
MVSERIPDTMSKVYVVATIRHWNIKVYHEVIKKYPGEWHLITDPKNLNLETIQLLKPRYIFFPHWSHIVPRDILDSAECVCFHETDLPYGRGGSPIQNLIARGHRETVISALRMVEELDAGPIYMKRPLSLEGLGEEIFIRASRIVAEMIKEMIIAEPTPKVQEGRPTVFKRRKPYQSQISMEPKSLLELFDHIRMLDAEEYPKAFIEHGGLRYEISRPALRTEAIEATVVITQIPKK